MKRALTVTALVITFLAVFSTMSKATTKSELLEYLEATHTVAGQEIYLTAENKVKLERYFSENEITDEQATAIKAKFDEGIALMDNAGVSQPSKLSTESKKELLKIAQEAVAEIGLTLTYNSKDQTIEIYKNGTQIEAVATSTNKFVQTGSSNIGYIIAGVAIIAVATAVIVKVKKTNV